MAENHSKTPKKLGGNPGAIDVVRDHFVSRNDVDLTDNQWIEFSDLISEVAQVQKSDVSRAILQRGLYGLVESDALKAAGPELAKVERKGRQRVYYFVAAAQELLQLAAEMEERKPFIAEASPERMRSDASYLTALAVKVADDSQLPEVYSNTTNKGSKKLRNAAIYRAVEAFEIGAGLPLSEISIGNKDSLEHEPSAICRFIYRFLKIGHNQLSLSRIYDILDDLKKQRKLKPEIGR